MLGVETNSPDDPNNCASSLFIAGKLNHRESHFYMEKAVQNQYPLTGFNQYFSLPNTDGEGFHLCLLLHTVRAPLFPFSTFARLREPVRTPFKVSVLAKLHISFAVLGFMCDISASSCLPLAAVSAERMESRAGESVQTFTSMITLSRIENRGEPTRAACERISHFSCRHFHRRFHYETSSSHFPVESSPQCGEPLSNHSLFPKLQPSQYCI